MSSQIEIVNKALGLISVQPITSMSEASPAAQLATSIWDSCRKECLRGHDWAFALVIQTMSTANYVIVNHDWQFAYQYPTNAIAVWRCYYNHEDKSQSFREVWDATNNAKVILSNTVDAICEFTIDMTDPTPYDANFVNVLSYFLAFNMAKPLTGDADLAAKMLDMYNKYMSEAERMSSYESDIGMTTPQRSAFVDARAGSFIQGVDDHYQAIRHPNG